MRSAQRLGWWSSSYGSTLATKLDGVQGKVGHLVIDETVRSGRCCVTTERVVQSSQSYWVLHFDVRHNKKKGYDSRSECHGTIEAGGSTDREGRDTDANQRMQGYGLSIRMVPQRRDFRGVFNPLLSWRESIGCKRGRGGGECKGKLLEPRQGRRAEAKKLHKTDVDGFLIKIAESEGLRVDVGVLDQGTK
ncbi:hypothetical protein B296_00035899 [Ensete ventricosum]|uniref:Uncharacterized protein n=1 Tax=Ensete ventricosum TaxID=4639 RepID=A0A426XP83_ENSVE|nr:hypothetical protein B296_00035899 [Ensete ventricosum]